MYQQPKHSFITGVKKKFVVFFLKIRINSSFLINLPWLHKMLTLGESWVKGIQEFFILCNSLYSVIYIQIYNYFQIKNFFNQEDLFLPLVFLKRSESHSVMSDSLRPHGPYSPWNSPGQNTRVGRLSLLQEIFPTQVSHTAGRFFTSCATREAQEYWSG